MIRTSDEIPQSEHNEHRIRRARSWLEQSEKVESDEEKFMCLWIAFNAAYGAEPTGMNEDGITETDRFTNFLLEIIKRDEQNEIRTILLETYSGPIRILLNNQYVFKPFWQWVRSDTQVEDWSAELERRNKGATKALGKALERARNEDVHSVFREVFRRLYQLRNQVFHGGVTFKKGWGRTQLRDGSRIMAEVVPVMLKIMDENPESDWGKVAYPRVSESPD